MKIRLLGAIIFMTLFAARLVGQIPVGTKVGEPPASAGSYDSHGNRDPFLSLIAPRRAGNPLAPRMGTGLGSFLVADVVVTGITRAGDKWMAILQSPDRQSYVVKVKDRLADALVKSIDASSVTFLEIVEPGSSGRPREIRKLLHGIDEVKR
jgi:Tfp pilus assembly protein PilP